MSDDHRPLKFHSRRRNSGRKNAAAVTLWDRLEPPFVWVLFGSRFDAE